ELRLYRNTTFSSTVTSYGVLAPSTAANARREPLFSVLGANTCSTLVIFRLPRFRMAPVGRRFVSRSCVHVQQLMSAAQKSPCPASSSHNPGGWIPLRTRDNPSMLSAVREGLRGGALL